MSNEVQVIMNLLELLEINNEKKDNYQDKINIICLYPSYTMLKAILDDEKIFIATLTVYREVLESEEFLELILKNKNRIGRICSSLASYEEFYAMFKTDYQLDINEISKYRNAQLDCTREITRSVLPLVESDYRYFISLSFWLSIFSTYPIKFVLSATIYHGNLLDSPAFHIARQNNIPVYFLSFQLLMDTRQLVAVKKFWGEKETFLGFNKVLSESKIDLTPYCFHKMIQKKAKKAETQKFKHFFWLKIQRRIKFFINRLKLSKKELFLIKAGKFKSHFTYGLLEVAESLAYIKELRKIYKLLSCSIDENDKYVYFSLHLEPEASILNSSICASQLFYIKMIADNLPPGWKVYVKEHPYQFFVQNQRLWHCFYGIKNFRPMSFYEHIIKMKNVKLIDYTIPSKELVEHASAVASINGTVNFECLFSGKPLLFFQNSMSLISQIQNTYKITNGKDVYNALLKIDNGEFNSNTFQKEKFTPYLVEFDNYELFLPDENENKYKMIMQHIINDNL